MSRSTVRGARGAHAIGAVGVSPNQLYVTYRQSSARSAATIDSTSRAVRGVALGSSNGTYHRAITLPAGSDLAATTARLRANSDVVDVAPVHLRALATVANDPKFNNYNQWYLFKTDITPDGWSYSPDGSGVAIAVIDTGADMNNPDLSSKIDSGESVINGVRTVSLAAAQDTNGHGTNVAGLAAGATNNNYGYASTGYNARLQIYKVFPDTTSSSDEQEASTADEAQAIYDAIANGASIINLSLGAAPCGGFDQAEENAVEAAIAANVTVVAAGGNEYPSDGASPDYPAADPGVIAVGASSAIDNNTGLYSGITSEGVASYSNSGVTLVAPGGDPSSDTDPDYLHWIDGYSTTTTNYAPDQCSNSGSPPLCESLFAGTSQATPQVSGTIALMMAYHGGARSLTPASVLSILQANSDSIGQPSARQGAGRLNAGRAVMAAHP